MPTFLTLFFFFLQTTHPLTPPSLYDLHMQQQRLLTNNLFVQDLIVILVGRERNLGLGCTVHVL